jgi:ribonuclease Y
MDVLQGIGGMLAGAVGAFLLGYFLRSRLGKGRAQSAERQATSLLDQARREADSLKRDATLQGREESLRLKQQVEREVGELRTAQLASERAFQDKEAAFNRRVELVEKMERDLKLQENDLDARERKVESRNSELDSLVAEETKRLERVAGLTAEDARAQLIAGIEDEARAEASKLVSEVRENAQRGAEREARKVMSLAMQRYAADHVSESSVSVVHLPSDDMKGRIIGREGRNIRSFEVITGVDVIIDDTPEAVILSGFDPVRREIARLALERLVADGRIHPARIEEVVEKVKVEVENKIREQGELACLEVGAHGIHPDLQHLLGRLHYRTSYGQNILRHSIEVAHLSGIMAAEIGIDQKMAKRAGLGMEAAARYGEPQPVLEAIGYHHDDYSGGSLWPVLISAADAISGARPGARRESLEVYVKRLEALEKIANTFPGVEKSYAIQAGREVRIMVEHHKVDDSKAQLLAQEIARRIEKELQYPGQIRVTVIRETRAVDYAK